MCVWSWQRIVWRQMLLHLLPFDSVVYSASSHPDPRPPSAPSSDLATVPSQDRWASSSLAQRPCLGIDCSCWGIWMSDCPPSWTLCPLLFWHCWLAGVHLQIWSEVSACRLSLWCLHEQPTLLDWWQGKETTGLFRSLEEMWPCLMKILHFQHSGLWG